MIIFDYNISITHTHIIYILYLGLFIALATIIIGIFVSFWVAKYIRANISEYGVFFDKHTKASQKLLDVYGDCELKNIYVVRSPLPAIANVLLNIRSLYAFDKYMSENPDARPYHSALLCEIIPNKKTPFIKKFIMIEKDWCVFVRDNFAMDKNDELMKIKLTTELTINSLLENTIKRVGERKFFNWTIFKTNCNIFTKDLLTTLNCYTPKLRKFICNYHAVKNFISPTDFIAHAVSCLQICRNTYEKGIYDILFS